MNVPGENPSERAREAADERLIAASNEGFARLRADADATAAFDAETVEWDATSADGHDGPFDTLRDGD